MYGLKKGTFKNNIVLSGLVKVYEDMYISLFDEDEGFVTLKIEAGTYLFRALNVKGWITYQLFDERPDFGWMDLDMYQKDNFDVLTF